MKSCPKMKAVIETLLAHHELDLQAVGTRFCLEIPSRDRLCIARPRRSCIAVAHCFEVDDLLILEPEVVFFVGLDGSAWIPIELTHLLTGWYPVAVLSQDGAQILAGDLIRQARFALFAESWAEILRAQGWLETSMVCVGYQRANDER